MKKSLFLNLFNPNKSIILPKNSIDVNDCTYKTEQISLKKLAKIFDEFSNFDELLNFAKFWKDSQCKSGNTWLFSINSCKYQPLNTIDAPLIGHIFIPHKWDYNKFIEVRNSHRCNSECFMINGHFVGKLTETGFII